MLNRTGCLFVLAGVLFAALSLYIAGRLLPYDAIGEGPWPENYRW